MSAFIMPEEELNTIVSYFIHARQTVHGEGAWLKIGERYNYLNTETAPEVAKILMDENIRSVRYRYGEDEQMSYDSDYTFQYDPTAHKRPVGNIIGALDCLEYQSCETDDYHQSNAWDIMNGLRKHLLKVIAEKEETYTWGIQ